MNFKKDKSDLMGIFLLLASLMIFAFMVCLVVKYPFISNDEWYTTTMVNLPMQHMIQVTAGDVHPPLFYIILIGFISLFKVFSLNVDLIYIMKITAMIPYVILFIISLTKLRRDYGLLTAGIFSFTIISMSNFFTYFLIARMYSWPLLFLIVSFICLKDVIDKGDLKYWILLTVFSVLAAYSHYFAAVPLIIIYLVLFVYLLAKRKRINFKSEFKKYLASAVLAVLCYLPWSFILLNQMSQVHSSYHIKPLTWSKITEAIAYYLSVSANTFIQLGACIAILLAFLILAWKYFKTKEDDDFYILLGIFTFLATVGLSIIVSLLYKPILAPRYFLPVIGLAWLCVSIKLGQVDFKKIALPIIILLLIVGAFNVYHEYNDVLHEWDKTLYVEKVLDKINNNDSVIVYLSTNKYCRFNTYLDNVSEKYAACVVNNETLDINFEGFDLNYDPIVIPDYLREHPDKNVYIPLQGNPPKGEGFEFRSIGTVQFTRIYKVELV